MAKRILVFTNHYRPEHFKINEAVDWLVAAGHIVHVITAWPNYPSGKLFPGFNPIKQSFEKKENLSIRRLPVFPRGKGTKFRLIVNYLSYFLSTLCYTLYIIFFKKKYDKVLVHHTSPFFIAISGILYKRAKNVEALLWDLDLWPETLEAVGFVTSKSLLRWIRYFVVQIYQYYDVILVSSKSFIGEVKKRVPHQNIFYFPNWAESVLEQNQKKPTVIKHLYSGSVKIFYTGNIGYAQDFETLSKAIKSLPKGMFQWVFIGSGRYKDTLQKKLEKQIKNKEVIFLPNQHLEAIPSFVASADYLFFSLKNDPLFNKTVPAKLQGYMAAQKPILGMINGEGAKIIEASNCGFYVSPGNTKALIKVLLSAAALEPRRRHELALNGWEYYNKYFHSSLRKKQLLSCMID